MLAIMTDFFSKARDPDVFPPGVSQFSVTILSNDTPPPRLGGIELPEPLERAHAKRRIQFFAGRICAREAIEQLEPNVSILSLPPDAEGCPLWPDGLVGSISHTAAFATAAVGLRSEAHGLGVDVEPVMSREAAAEVARLVALDDETRRVARAASLDPLEALTLVFSTKESLFKALYPPMRRHFEYLDCEVVRLDPRARRAFLRFKPPFDAVFGAGEFSGRYALANGDVATGVLLRPTEMVRRG
jgi:enterobactin synthetase component D